MFLDTCGSYFWSPDWGSEPTPVPRTLPPGLTATEEILSVDLPAELDPGGPFYFYAALCEQGTYDLAGDFSGVAFWFE